MRALAGLTLLAVCAASMAMPAPKTIAELRQLNPDVELEDLGSIAGGEGFSARLYRYKSAGLKVHAMVATPLTPPPEGGYPVLVFNHGFHPDPPAYGYTEDGRDFRPGDYYRRIPALYAKHGLMVVIPDYRGHSNSEGVVFTKSLLDASYYTEDVVTLLAGIADIPLANTNRMFMMGHSMGGDVTLRTLVSAPGIRAASLWSTVGGDVWDQAYYYSRYEDPYANDSSGEEKAIVSRLKRAIDELSGPFDASDIDPLAFVEDLQTPVILHHATDDRSTAFKWSLQIAQALYLGGGTYRLFSYSGGAHLFEGDDLELAVQRDVTFFELYDAVDLKLVPCSAP